MLQLVWQSPGLIQAAPHRLKSCTPTHPCVLQLAEMKALIGYFDLDPNRCFRWGRAAGNDPLTGKCRPQPAAKGRTVLPHTLIMRLGVLPFVRVAIEMLIPRLAPPQCGSGCLHLPAKQ